MIPDIAELSLVDMLIHEDPKVRLLAQQIVDRLLETNKKDDKNMGRKERASVN